MSDKLILDACCGGRMFWFDKEHPAATYMDIREIDEPGYGASSHHREGYSFKVTPDVVADFRDMPFEDESFKLVVWDPPHLHSLTKTSIMAKKYGVLNTETWPYDLSKGFDECMRVLQPHGVLIFKWNEAEIPLDKVLGCFSQRPLFGHPTAKHGKTHWCVFMKGVSS